MFNNSKKYQMIQTNLLKLEKEDIFKYKRKDSLLELFMKRLKKNSL